LIKGLCTRQIIFVLNSTPSYVVRHQWTMFCQDYISIFLRI
jgi:hypothetical protein